MFKRQGKWNECPKRYEIKCVMTRDTMIECVGRDVEIKGTTSSHLNKNRNLYINDYSREVHVR
jgi:hypothetical protein